MYTNVYSYLETSGGISYNPYLNVVHFFNTSGLYYKTITIVKMTIVSDAQIWSVTFDAARGVIYDRNMAIPHVYGTGVICDDRQMTIVIVL